MHVDTRDGLAWDESGFDLTPVWTREPRLEAIENVCRNRLSLDDMETCDVTFYVEGSFNKLYLARTSNRQFLMRVSLPVHPHSKTLGEVTTLQFLRRSTNIPVPEVFAYDESASNEIGYEWILMELMPGVPAYKKWRTLTTFQKAALVQQIAEFQAQMFQHTFSGIGTLTPGEEAAAQNEKPGEIVSIRFFSGNRFNFDIARGPFRSTHDWLVSYLEFVIRNHTLSKEEAEDEEDEEDAAFALSVTNRLVELLPKIFPALQNPPERSVLWHQDLNLNNILVDEKGKVTAVVDWECVSAMPSWMATGMPEFLTGSTREEEPKREKYADETPEEAQAVGPAVDADIDNEGKTELYWVHLMEYETTQLRDLYMRWMCQLRPGWAAEVKENTLKDDFFNAVLRCDGGFALKRILQWVDAVENGEYPRLMDVLQAGFKVE
ncbi:Aminoglycoside phosphotransferase [Penicillium italicum]|uniref:Aminoglycoside phosphotransferase n=1 Tax=Penicillium italicum TaxID=40296 RepID=A0A0A2LD82_PENIT|nr:Aminoglycoside phosphotransferase [Penicillium italicum]